MTDSLIPDVNPTRTPWCFLTIEQSGIESSTSSCDSQIIDWQIGDGNPEQLVYLTSHSAEFGGEAALETLGRKLTERQHDDRLLITPSRETIKLLRTRLAQSHLDKESPADNGRTKIKESAQPSLHGFRFLPLQETLQKKFANHPKILQETNLVGEEDLPKEDIEECGPTTMWQITRSIFPLLPVAIATGEAI